LAEDEVAVEDDGIIARDPARGGGPEAGEMDGASARVGAADRAERRSARRDDVRLDPGRLAVDRAGAAEPQLADVLPAAVVLVEDLECVRGDRLREPGPVDGGA